MPFHVNELGIFLDWFTLRTIKITTTKRSNSMATWWGEKASFSELNCWTFSQQLSACDSEPVKCASAKECYNVIIIPMSSVLSMPSVRCPLKGVTSPQHILAEEAKRRPRQHNRRYCEGAGSLVRSDDLWTEVFWLFSILTPSHHHAAATTAEMIEENHRRGIHKVETEFTQTRKSERDERMQTFIIVHETTFKQPVEYIKHLGNEQHESETERKSSQRIWMFIH